MKYCHTCQSEMTPTRIGDWDVLWHCNCDLTHVEGDGTSPGVSLASLQEDTYDPWDNEVDSEGKPYVVADNETDLVEALGNSLLLCELDVPEPRPTFTARTGTDA